ncbi:MAG TPA: intradiol ring-cleavage dioxygenase [Pyrinomonadaceae bacterium]|jgi:protocatechuate 3,4-dioxygenase beta subunit
MNDDDKMGKLLSRRDWLALFGAAGVAVLAGCAGETAKMSAPATSLPPCIGKLSQTLGPYFVEEKLNRSDIRTDAASGAIKEGLPLQIEFRVSHVGENSCTPLEGATVDVWHCDAAGVYSDVKDPSFNTVGQKFLRGFQTTDANGVARFTTNYPGWYEGRTVHIHFKIRHQNYDFTSQLYFDDALTDKVHAQSPYAAKGQRTLKNAGDDIFKSGGSDLVLTLAETEQGYKATFEIGLQTA